MLLDKESHVCVCVLFVIVFFCFHNHTTVNNITHMHRNKRWIKTKPLRHVEINVRKPITKKHSFGNRTSAVGHSKKPTNKAIGRLATREAVYRRYRTDKLTPQRLGINRKTSLGHGFDPWARARASNLRIPRGNTRNKSVCSKGRALPRPLPN